ncbi:MAG: hypothetical protein Q9160_009325 [Pyrenula sp. 1 TL-2023]
MAEPVGFAASILTLASTGIQSITVLYRFKNAYTGAESQIENIAGALSVTSAILLELGHSVAKSQADLQKLERWGLFSSTFEHCKKNFDVIDTAIKLSRKSHGANEKKEVNRWEKFKWAIGGQDRIAQVLRNLETSKENLHMLLEVSNFDTLRRIEKL